MQYAKNFLSESQKVWSLNTERNVHTSLFSERQRTKPIIFLKAQNMPRRQSINQSITHTHAVQRI